MLLRFLNGLKSLKIINVSNNEVWNNYKYTLFKIINSGNEPKVNIAYSAFPLIREPETTGDEAIHRNDYYCVTLAECQFLCNITNLCLYFNLDLRTSCGKCWLKYGMGRLNPNKPDYRFGHKNHEGLCIIIIIPPLELIWRDMFSWLRATNWMVRLEPLLCPLWQRDKNKNELFPARFWHL